MKKHAPIFVMLAGAAMFVAGAVYLLLLRFEAGDVYPPYSSLRADPLGTMALYESLEHVPGISARRDFSATQQLPEGRDLTYLHLAAPMGEWRFVSDELFQEIDKFLARGGRLVIAFYPQSSNFRVRSHSDDEPTRETYREKPKDSPPRDDKAPPDDNQPPDEKRSMGRNPRAAPKKKPEGPDRPEDSPLFFKFSSLKEHWGVDVSIIDLPHGDRDVFQPVTVTNRGDLPLPPRLDLHSGVVFTNIVSTWRTLYSRGAHPVMIARSFGRGSVVIVTDSYWFSNEALQKDRHADLLAWFVGGGKNVVFDEAHLGVQETSGVAMLMRKYRLHGVALGLVLRSEEHTSEL